MRLIESTRATTFAAPRVPRSHLEGVPAEVAAAAETPLAGMITLPALEHLPPALAHAIAEYRQADQDLEAFRRNTRGTDPGETSAAIAAKESARYAAWVAVRQLVHEQRAGLVAHARDAKADAIERLRNAAAELNAAAHAYVAAATLEVAIGDNSLAVRPGAVPAISVLDAALTGTSHDGSTGDGLHAALAAITT